MTGQDDLANQLKEDDDYSWNDDLPSKLYKIIHEGISRKKREPVAPDKISWGHLGHIIRSYLQERRDNEGYLNKTQAAEIKKLKNRAKKMLDDLSRLREVNALWYLESEFKDAGLSSKQLENLLNAVSVVSTEKPRPPWLERGKKLDDGSVDLTIKDLRSELQISLDIWWKNNTGLSKNIPLVAETPYALFLSEIFGRIRLQNPPGASRAAVQASRNSAKKREQADEERRKKFANGLKELSKSAVTRH
ncbi:MAG: hypothetical protein GY798_08555 [Hyphomicrobiales bacterium]|nr:hypothetical protein [Hyphomicrobiales bacterium]